MERNRLKALAWGVLVGVLLVVGTFAAWGQLPPDREPDVVLLRDGKRIDCVVVSISNEVLYYNVLGREGLQQVELHRVMTIALGGPKVDLLAQAKQQAAEARKAQEARQAEEARRAEEARAAEEAARAAAKRAEEEAQKASQAKKEEAAGQVEASKPSEGTAQDAQAHAEQNTPAAGHETGTGNAVVPNRVASSDAWKDIIVTKNEGDIKGMLFVDKYDITLTQSSNWSRAKSDEMELGATIQLQKRAVQRRATHLLIRTVEFKRTYGEPPAIRIVGEAYRKRN